MTTMQECAAKELLSDETIHACVVELFDLKSNVVQVGGSKKGCVTTETLVRTVLGAAVKRIRATGPSCSKCGGQGYTLELRSQCCGNPYPHGECRAHCAVPEECQEQCADCGGSGERPADSDSTRAALEECVRAMERVQRFLNFGDGETFNVIGYVDEAIAIARNALQGE